MTRTQRSTAAAGHGRPTTVLSWPMVIAEMRRLTSVIQTVRSPVTERASATDLAFLSMDSGPVPQQFGVVLVLAPSRTGFDLSRAESVISERAPAIPRLRQRLVPVPPGCGRPIWVDDTDFDIRRHLRRVPCTYPGDERALLDTAVAIIGDPLPRSRPLWCVVFVTGLADGAVALVVVLHHALADGIGGLAVLANLADTAAVRPAASPPGHPPSQAQLAVDAFRTRLYALRHMPVGWLHLRASMAAAGGLAPARATPCSLIQPTGPNRRLTVARADLAALREVAHRHGGTVNDAVLTAVAGALHRVLKSRGESVANFTVAVPVAGRRSATPSQLGNQVAPMLITVPDTDDPLQRLHQIAVAVQARKASATGPPPIAVLGPVFRGLTSLGGYRWYMNHQHRLHTLVSHIRGPDQPITFAGATVSGAIPVALGAAGNITVSFEVLSYAGTVTITAIADPDHFPDLPTLTDALNAELALLTLEPR